jgi:hypothetical protein
MYADIAERWPGDDAHAAAVLDFGVRYEQAILDWLGAAIRARACGATGAVDAVERAGKLHRMVERVAVLAPMISEPPVVRPSG